MPIKRTYGVKSSKDFLVLGGIFFFLCLWAVRDAWYPSDKVLKKHPQVIKVSFDSGGVVGKIHVKVDDAVAEGMLLAEMRCTKLELDHKEAKGEYTEAKNKYARMQDALRRDGGGEVAAEELVQAKTVMDIAYGRVKGIRAAINSTKLLAPEKGRISEVSVATYDQVEGGAPVLVIDPEDHFYLFNKSLAILSFFAFWIFLGLHFLAQ